MSEDYFAERGTYYRSLGKADAPALVLIHGLSGSSSAWRRMESIFAKQYRIVSVDLRGHGFSRRPKRFVEYAVNLLAQDIAELLLHLGISQAIYIGHSFGTLVVFSIMAQYPSTVRGSILLSPEYDVARRFSTRLLKAMMHPVRYLERFPFAHPQGGHIEYEKKFKGTGDWNIRRLFADICNTGIRSFLFATYHALSVSYTDCLHSFTAPILLVHGDMDTIFPVENTHELQQLLPNAESVIIPGADHILVINHGDALVPIIDAWLARYAAK